MTIKKAQFSLSENRAFFIELDLNYLVLKLKNREVSA